jgi:oligopeptide transport system substrate-binding protein
VAVLLLGASCSNSPYGKGESAEATSYTAISSELQDLDPASSYATDEYQIISQIYEPPFQYHYLKRPYEVIAGTSEAVSEPVFFDHAGEVLHEADPEPATVGQVEYTIRIRPKIQYAPHPCFARKADGTPFYRGIAFNDLNAFSFPSDMPEKGSRSLEAKDYALQLRRLADLRLACPVFESTFKKYILGMDGLAEQIETAIEAQRSQRRRAAEAAGRRYNSEQDEREHPIVVDYMALDCPGVEVVDALTYKLTLKAVYPQIRYWLCMPFCAPMPQEALDFYAEPAMVKKQFTANRCPVGTGPYYLDVFRPNEKIVLKRNPLFHDAFYPSEGAPGDAEAGLLVDAGKKLPFIEQQVWMVEKEVFSSWQKFLQGYYDNSGINEEAFDKAVQQTDSGTELSESMRARGINMQRAIKAVYYELQFNMLDPLVGGLDAKQCKLRQAISIALDFNEYADIFMNGRAILPNSPLPPSIFGSRSGPAGVNRYVHEWDPVQKSYKVRSIEDARRLLAEAGYPQGLTPEGQPLVVTLNHGSGGDSQFKERVQWYQRQLGRIGVVLQDQGTDRTQMQKVMRSGNWQLTIGGWGSDYPDPENFLFLYYGANGQKKFMGMNRCNYESPEYDRLFRKMERMSNGPERKAIIDEMLEVLAHDAPSVLMFYPISFYLRHDWLKNVKLHDNTHNVIQYYRIDGADRAMKQDVWNRPTYWPIVLLGLGLVALILPACIRAHRHERGL